MSSQGCENDCIAVTVPGRQCCSVKKSFLSEEMFVEGRELLRISPPDSDGGCLRTYWVDVSSKGLGFYRVVISQDKIR